RVRAERYRHRIGPVWKLLAPIAIVQRPAAMAEPAHDDLVAADDLLAIDAEVLSFLIRPLGDGQAPGNQRRRIARPTGLYRQLRQIDIIAFQDHFLTGGVLEYLGGHADDLAEDRQLVPGVFQPLRRLRLLEIGQQSADLAQFAYRFGPHAHGHALRRAEQVAQHRHIKAGRVLEEQRRPLLAQGPIAYLGHFQNGRNRHSHTLELATFFQATDKVAQIAILHA